MLAKYFSLQVAIEAKDNSRPLLRFYLELFINFVGVWLRFIHKQDPTFDEDRMND